MVVTITTDMEKKQRVEVNSFHNMEVCCQLHRYSRCQQLEFSVVLTTAWFPPVADLLSLAMTHQRYTVMHYIYTVTHTDTQ